MRSRENTTIYLNKTTKKAVNFNCINVYNWN